MYDGEEDSVGLALGFTSVLITVYEDKRLYPVETFIAEVGGTLGLFLGFSFLGFWDIVPDIIQYFKAKYNTL